jgi:hypothetical protein
MTQNTPYYAHSGNTPVLSILFTLIFGLVAAAVLSVVYGYAIFYIPFIYLNFFITLGFGAFVGMAVGAGGKLGKARNPKFYGVIGLIFGSFALYAGWVVYFYAGSGQSFLPFQLTELWSNMEFLAYSGSWSIFGWTPIGWQLYAIWAIEALMIVGACSVVAFSYVESTPFCEECNTWIENEQTKAGFKDISDRDSFKASVEKGEIELITNLEKAESNSSNGTEIQINSCSSCNNNNFVSLECVAVTMDKDGNLSKDADKLISNLRVSHEHFSELASL